MAQLLNVQITQAGYEADDAKLQNIDFSIHKGELIGLIGAKIF